METGSRGSRSSSESIVRVLEEKCVCALNFDFRILFIHFLFSFFLSENSVPNFLKRYPHVTPTEIRDTAKDDANYGCYQRVWQAQLKKVPAFLQSFAMSKLMEIVLTSPNKDARSSARLLLHEPISDWKAQCQAVARVLCLAAREKRNRKVWVEEREDDESEDEEDEDEVDPAVEHIVFDDGDGPDTEVVFPVAPTATPKPAAKKSFFSLFFCFNFSIILFLSR